MVFLLIHCISEILPPQSELNGGLRWDAMTIKAFNEMKRLMENNLLSPETIQSWKDAFMEVPTEKAHRLITFYYKSTGCFEQDPGGYSMLCIGITCSIRGAD